MIDITLVFIVIVVLFGLFMVGRSVAQAKVCALCGATVVTWVVLLGLLYGGYAISPTLLGLLIGGSVVGVMYWLESKLAEKYQLFKLPFFLTLMALAYFVLEQVVLIEVGLVVGLLWLLALLVYVGRDTKNLKMLSRKLIECCKNW